MTPHLVRLRDQIAACIAKDSTILAVLGSIASLDDRERTKLFDSLLQPVLTAAMNFVNSRKRTRGASQKNRDRNLKILELHRNGKTPACIVKHLKRSDPNLTKNAVLGVLRRAKLRPL